MQIEHLIKTMRITTTDEVEMMQNLVAAAVERAKEEGAQHIRMVQIQVGEAVGIARDSLQHAFEIAKRGTIAQDAKLQVVSVPLVCYCATCDEEFKPIDALYECPDCRQPYCEVRWGKEFDIDFLEVS